MQPIPDMAALLKIVQSPAGQQLLSLLQSSNADLSQIASAAAAGNLEEAKQKLGSILATKEAQTLMKQLEKQL